MSFSISRSVRYSRGRLELLHLGIQRGLQIIHENPPKFNCYKTCGIVTVSREVKLLHPAPCYRIATTIGADGSDLPDPAGG